MKTLLKVLIKSFTISLLLIPMGHAEQYAQAPEIRAVPPPIMDRGSIVIPRDIFPEAKEASVPIYVPPVVEGSNATIRDDWKTVIELKGIEVNLLATGLAGVEIFKGIFGPGKGEPAKAQQLLDVKTEYKITIQESPKGDFRAIIQTSGIDRTIQRITETIDSREIIKEERGVAHILDVDRTHRDDPYIAYVSLSPDKKTVDITPKIYPQDKVILRSHDTFLGIPLPWTYKDTEIKGEALVNYLIPLFKMGIDVGLLEKVLSDEKVISSMSISRMDTMAARWEQIKDKVKEKANEFLKKQLISYVLTEALSLPTLPVKIGVGLAWPKTVLAPTSDASQLAQRTAQQQLTPVKDMPFTQTFSGPYEKPSSSPYKVATYSNTGPGFGTRSGVFPGNFSANYSITATSTENNTFSSYSSGTFSANMSGKVSGFREGTLKGTGNMNMNAGTTGGTNFSFLGPVTVEPSGKLTFETNGTFTLGNNSGTTTGTWTQVPK